MKNQINKIGKLLIISCILIITFSCSDDDTSCKYTEAIAPCPDLPLDNENRNMTVATFLDLTGNPQVGAIYDTRNNALAPYGEEWGTSSSPVSVFHPSNWTVNDLGAIFGIAIDDSENVFLATSDIYHLQAVIPTPSSNATRPYGAAQIFISSPPSYTAVPYVSLPNFNDPGNGIGNIAYDKKNEQLFASNLEDGKIYRIKSGAIVETYDPWAADLGLVDGMTIQDEQIWAVGVNYESGLVKVYFPRVTLNNASRELFSITLNPDGSFPSAGSEIVEIPILPGNQLTITDIAFSSSTNELLIAERGSPHNSTVHSYSLSGTSWGLNIRYNVGGFSGDNAAGGVDFIYKDQDNGQGVCDEYFWASGNYLEVRNGPIRFAYGLEGIQYSGNNPSSAPSPTANMDTDLFIDFDGISSTLNKGGIGDVEVFDSNACFNICP